LRKPKAGFVGFGEVNTPRAIIERKCLEARGELERRGIDVVYTAPVSDDPGGKEALRACKELTGEDFDLLVVCIAGWIPSHAVIRVINDFRHKPLLLWGLAGDYAEDGRLVSTADQAGTAALKKPMEDMGYKFKFVYNCPGSRPNVGRLEDFARAARAVTLLKNSKVGLMGFRDMNLYATLFDGVSLRGKIGPEVEVFEMLEIVQKMERLNQRDVGDVVGTLREKWSFERPPREETLERGVGFYLAIREKVEERDYQAVSLIDVDGMKRLTNFPPAMILMLLSDEAHVCTIPENDALGAVTQLMVRYLTGQIGAYMEIYEFMEDRILLGVPDYVPSEIVDGPVKVTTTNFGGFGEGILNVSGVKAGRVTLSRLSSKGDKYTMHIVTGKAVKPRKWEEAGWKPPAPQLPSLEVILDIPVEKFAEKVLSQHYIISYGDNTGALMDLCGLLDIEVI
jgi:L-fucose isomerase-like protein